MLLFAIVVTIHVDDFGRRLAVVYHIILLFPRCCGHTKMMKKKSKIRRTQDAINKGGAKAHRLRPKRTTMQWRAIMP